MYNKKVFDSKIIFCVYISRLSLSRRHVMRAQCNRGLHKEREEGGGGGSYKHFIQSSHGYSGLTLVYLARADKRLSDLSLRKKCAFIRAQSCRHYQSKIYDFARDIFLKHFCIVFFFVILKQI